MKTVLLWGSAWWVEDAASPLPFTGPTEAAAVLARHWEAERPRLRIIYQPDELEAIGTACPRANRLTLGQALSGEYPALTRAETTWSHEPILPEGEGFTTILHCQKKGLSLAELAGELEDQGFPVDSAWPLGTFLSAIPAEWSESGATTVLLAEKDRACAFHHGKDGRLIQRWLGKTALEEAYGWIVRLIAQNETEPLVIVTPEGDASAEATFGCFGRMSAVQMLYLRQALQGPVILPKHHPAQLLSPAALITPSRVLLAASACLFLGTVAMGIAYGIECRAWARANESGEEKKSVLRTEIAHLRSNEAQIHVLEKDLAERAFHVPAVELLDRVAATVPGTVALDTVRVASSGFSLQGHVAPKAPPGIVESWRGQLTSPHWEISPAAQDPSGSFGLTGHFKA